MNGYDMKQKRITKAMVESMLTHYLGVQGLTFARLKDTPDLWRHSCYQTGVVLLKPVSVNLSGLPVVYACCGHCGKTRYYFDSPDVY